MFLARAVSLHQQRKLRLRFSCMVHNTIALQISMLNVWLVGWRIVWMVGWVTEWLIGWLGDGLAAQHDWLADQLAE